MYEVSEWLTGWKMNYVQGLGVLEVAKAKDGIFSEQISSPY